MAQFIDQQLAAGGEELYAQALRRLERLLVTKVLQHTGGNQLQAAKVLGITRGTLRTKLATLGLAAAAGLAGAVVGGAGAAVGLGAPPVWQALTKSANADAPAASKRNLRIGLCSFRGNNGRVEGRTRATRALVHSSRSGLRMQARWFSADVPGD